MDVQWMTIFFSIYKLSLLGFSLFGPICRIENLLDKENESNIFVDIKPERGLLVLFPSWLLHEVLPGNKEKCIRTCLAFNLI